MINKAVIDLSIWLRRISIREISIVGVNIGRSVSGIDYVVCYFGEFLEERGITTWLDSHNF